MAEGSMGLAVLEQGLLSGLVAFGFLSVRWGIEGVIIEVPRQGGKVPERDWRVEQVVAASLVGRGSQGGGCCFV